MPQFATFDSLREWGALEEVKGYSFLKEAALRGKNTFLSHRSIDDDKVNGAARILENHGARVYLDHRDPHNQSDDCVEIAAHVRSVIRSCPRFVMFATSASADSKWIPWEMGLADGIHSESNVAIFPGAERAFDQDWAEREYLGLYKKIVWGRIEGYQDELWMVWDPRKNAAKTLRKWLQN